MGARLAPLSPVLGGEGRKQASRLNCVPLSNLSPWLCVTNSYSGNGICDNTLECPEVVPMVDNAPILTHQHGGLTIEGYSRAAVQSYWRIPELKIGFDLGAQPWDFMGTPTWLLTHTHLDHVAALPVYIARRRMMKMEPPRIYLPEPAIEDIRRLLLVMQRLDRGRMICELNGV